MEQKQIHAEALEDVRSDHLLLLVGGNPLPNAVAGKLLTAREGTITLFHSRGAAGTGDVAQRLCAWLNKQGVVRSVGLKEVEESNPTSIFSGVQERLNSVGAHRVGLNYTGGTKAMSVHAYRAVEQWAKEKNTTPVFSYLDARTLQMVFDPNGGSGEWREYVGRALELKLRDLLALHGWALKCEPTQTPLFPTTARALATACANDEGFEDWKKWIDDEFRSKCRRSGKEDWKNKTQLQAVSLTLPTSSSLREVVQSLHSELRVSGGNLGLVHGAFGNEPKRFCEWLFGKWLEHYVLDILNDNDLVTQLYLHECAQNIVPNEVEFDVDVMALRGYQLFAFSCSTDTQKGRLKLKLFEAYVRARQLGGDEARIALVCCSNDSDGLENEMRRDVDPGGRIHVFGRKHLGNLTEHIKTWIQSQSREEG